MNNHQAQGKQIAERLLADLKAGKIIKIGRDEIEAAIEDKKERESIIEATCRAVVELSV